MKKRGRNRPRYPSGGSIEPSTKAKPEKSFRTTGSLDIVDQKPAETYGTVLDLQIAFPALINRHATESSDIKVDENQCRKAYEADLCRAEITRNAMFEALIALVEIIEKNDKVVLVCAGQPATCLADPLREKLTEMMRDRESPSIPGKMAKKKT